MQHIPYTNTLNIKNVENLPRGTGCKYLEVIESHIEGEYIAKQWRRSIANYEYANIDNDDAIVIEFNR